MCVCTCVCVVMVTFIKRKSTILGKRISAGNECTRMLMNKKFSSQFICIFIGTISIYSWIFISLFLRCWKYICAVVMFVHFSQTMFHFLSLTTFRNTWMQRIWCLTLFLCVTLNISIIIICWQTHPVRNYI